MKWFKQSHFAQGLAVCLAATLIASQGTIPVLATSGVPSFSAERSGKTLLAQERVEAASPNSQLRAKPLTANENSNIYLPLIVKSSPNTAPTMTDWDKKPLANTDPVLINQAETYSIYVYDRDNTKDQLQLAATSTNQAVLPNANIEVVRASGSSFDDYVAFDVVITATALGATDLNLIATDSDGGQTTHTMQITVRDSNAAPVFSTIADQTTDLSTPITLNFTVTDADGDPITLSDDNSPDMVTYSFGGSGDNRTVTITPTRIGKAYIYIKAFDGIKSADPQLSFNLTITKSGANRAPTITTSDHKPLESTARVLINQKERYSIYVDDLDNTADTLKLTATSNNQAVLPDANIQVVNNTSSFSVYGQFDLEITAIAAGVTDLNLVATDSDGGQTSHTMQITVKDSNVAPVLSTIADQTTNLSTPITLNFTATDADSDPITLSAGTLDGNIATLSFGGSGDHRTVTITPTRVGTADIYIDAEDGIPFVSTRRIFKLTVTK